MSDVCRLSSVDFRDLAWFYLDVRAIPVRRQLPDVLAGELELRIRAGEWEVGARLPTEVELVSQYGMSRSTVRAAVKSMERQGLVSTHQGRGTFLADMSTIHTGMQKLSSITATIAETGHDPDMVYHHRRLRRARPDEQVRFELGPDDEVLDIQRRILADGVTVAYSYDVLPRWVLPTEFRPRDLSGSVFAFLAENGGPEPVRAVSEVHAVDRPDVGWGEERGEHRLFVLLDQLHRDRASLPVMHSRSYFIEGRFTFTVVRTT